MGRASRRKQDRIKIAEGSFFRLRAALATRDAFLKTAELEAKKQDAQVAAAMRAAGLDPERTYELDDQTLTATPRG